MSGELTIVECYMGAIGSQVEHLVECVERVTGGGLHTSQVRTEIMEISVAFMRIGAALELLEATELEEDQRHLANAQLLYMLATVQDVHADTAARLTEGVKSLGDDSVKRYPAIPLLVNNMGMIADGSWKEGDTKNATVEAFVAHEACSFLCAILMNMLSSCSQEMEDEVLLELRAFADLTSDESLKDCFEEVLMQRRGGGDNPSD